MATDFTLTVEQAAKLSRTDQALLVHKDDRIYRFSRRQVVHQEVRFVRDDERRYRCQLGSGPHVVADQVFRVIDLTPRTQIEWTGRVQLFFDLEDSLCSEQQSFGLAFFGNEPRERLHVGLKSLGFLTEHQQFENQLLPKKRQDACYHGVDSLLRFLESNPEPVDDLLDQISALLVQLHSR